MTRFARSKGSKASNERLPEEATTWSEMKQQLLDKNKEVEESKKRKEAHDKRNASYKAFLEEKEGNDSKNVSWAEFPENSDFKNKTSKNKNGTVTVNNDSDSDEAPEEQSSKKEIIEPTIPKKKKLKTKLLKITLENEKKQKDNDEEQKNKRTMKRKITDTENKETVSKKKIKGTNIDQDSTSTKPKPNTTKQKKIVKENLTERDIKKIEKKKQKRIKQLEKKKRLKAESKKQNEDKQEEEGNVEDKKSEGEIVGENKSLDETIDNNQNKNISPKKTFNKEAKPVDKKKKIRNNEEHTRRKPQLPHKMFINGKELDIEYVDGFPIKKEDAIRLKKLKREMISKGLPRSEINIALKLERRKAEKAFTREKKKVCFHCRNSGHNLSECPNLDKNEVAQTIATGICFKCGSTEHTHFECKVVRGQEFKYATCFICNEQGHIARQCPDNARGLYPKGGACKVCGDVTHLKKDCPKYQAQQHRQEENLKVETLGFSNPDVLEEGIHNNQNTLGNKKPNKIIKF